MTSTNTVGVSGSPWAIGLENSSLLGIYDSCVFIKTQIEPRLCNPTAGFKVPGFQPSSSVSVFGLTKKTTHHDAPLQDPEGLKPNSHCVFLNLSQSPTIHPNRIKFLLYPLFTHYSPTIHPCPGPSGILGLFLLTIASFSSPMVCSSRRVGSGVARAIVGKIWSPMG